MQGASADVVRHMDWECFQQTLLELDAVPVLIVRSANAEALRWLLEAVTQGTVLAAAKSSGKLELRWTSLDLTEDIDVLSLRSRYATEGIVIHLSPIQRFELLLRKSDGDKVAYLRSALSRMCLEANE